MRYLLPSSTTVQRRESGVWTVEELGEVWKACWGTWFEPAMLLAGFGGCRVGKAMAVRSGDVRVERIRDTTVAFVRIERQVDAHAHVVERTKNQWSTRTALLAGLPAKRLASLAAQCKSNVLLTKIPEDRRTSQKDLRLAIAQRLEECEVPIHLFKNLRKSWQTNARWILRLPPWIVEPIMGHVGTSVTAHHYDSPGEQEYAEALVDAWTTRPFGDQYSWLQKRMVVY